MLCGKDHIYNPLPPTCKLYGTNHLYLYILPLQRVVGKVLMCPRVFQKPYIKEGKTIP
jgi:hypothetical protein